MDIATTDDVALLVDRFYGKVRCDALLGPIFNDVAQVDWPAHMATLYSLWETMLLGTGTYRGAPFPKHAVLPVEKAHFDRWLELFLATVDVSCRRAPFCCSRSLRAGGRREQPGRLRHVDLTSHLRQPRSLRSLRRNVSRTANTTMKRITSLAAAAAALLALAGCDQKTSDDLKQKVETTAKEAKEAADRGIEKAKPKVEELIDKTKEAAKEAEPKLKELGEKAKEAGQEAIEQGRELTDSAAEKLKEATREASPEPATPTPTP